MQLALKAKSVAQRVQRDGTLRPDTPASHIREGPRARDSGACNLMRHNRNLNDVRLTPEYRIYSHSSGEPLHTVEMHVLARAYKTAWRSLFADDPLGPHAIGPLDVLFIFFAEGVEDDC